MITLPPGCSINHPITVEIKSLTDTMVNWYRSVGGQVMEKEQWNHRGNLEIVKFVQYGKAKFCHHRKDGTSGVRLHFHGDDASVATLFIMTFPEYVEEHNISEHYSLQ